MINKNIVDDIVAYISGKPNGVNSQRLAEIFLKFKSPDKTIAHLTIKEILKNDVRCTCKTNNLWYYNKLNNYSEKQSLQQIPWVAVYLLSSPNEPNGKIYHISAWSLFELTECLLSEWLIDPALLPHNEREMLTSNQDSPFKSKDIALSRIAGVLEDCTALFFTFNQQRTLSNYNTKTGVSITDDTMLISQLFKINSMTIPKPFDLKTCYTHLFNKEPLIQAACHYGNIFSRCAKKLLSKLAKMGIASREQLEQRIQKQTLLSTWTSARFSLLDILHLPQTPGVYGFKNTNGEYIYIGKAKNLKKRLSSYFRNTEESPEKLIKLRDQAFEFTVYTCGSELESLVFEYRLIKKYSPILNAKININERKGFFKPLHDCIILLPHAEFDKCMSFWFRENQKTLLKPLLSNFLEKEKIIEQLNHFFFSQVLPVTNSDFPEQEIIFRWVKQHEDTLQIIPVYRLSSPEDIYVAMKSCWNSNTK